MSARMEDALVPEPPEPPVKVDPKLPATPNPPEQGGPKGPEPTRYGDWERGGRAIDF